MRKFGIIRKLFLGVGILFFSMLSCTAEKNGQKELAKDMKINIKVNGRVLTALLYNNSSAKALITLLEGAT